MTVKTELLIPAGARAVLAEIAAKDPCRFCEGTGKVVLFTSLEGCSECGGRGRKKPWTNSEKQKFIRELISTPEGRAKLDASLTFPVRRGCRYCKTGEPHPKQEAPLQLKEKNHDSV